MDHYVALATLPSGSTAYIPAQGLDRSQAAASLGPELVVHALFTDEQLRAAQVAIEMMDDTDVRKRFAVVMVMEDDSAVLVPVWAHTPRDAQALAATQALGPDGKGPKVNVGAFEMREIQAMRDCLITGRIHHPEDPPAP